MTMSRVSNYIIIIWLDSCSESLGVLCCWHLNGTLQAQMVFIKRGPIDG